MEMLINREPDMEMFAEANDSTEALAILKLDHHPDIVLNGCVARNRLRLRRNVARHDRCIDAL
jgi:hypothetical protein